MVDGEGKIRVPLQCMERGMQALKYTNVGLVVGVLAGYFSCYRTC